MEGNRDAPANRRSAPDQRQRVMQHVIRHAQAARAQARHDLGGARLRTLRAAAGGGATYIWRSCMRRMADYRKPEKAVARSSKRFLRAVNTSLYVRSLDSANADLAARYRGVVWNRKR